MANNICKLTHAVIEVSPTRVSKSNRLYFEITFKDGHPQPRTFKLEKVPEYEIVSGQSDPIVKGFKAVPRKGTRYSYTVDFFEKLAAHYHHKYGEYPQKQRELWDFASKHWRENSLLNIKSMTARRITTKDLEEISQIKFKQAFNRTYKNRF